MRLMLWSVMRVPVPRPARVALSPMRPWRSMGRSSAPVVMPCSARRNVGPGREQQTGSADYRMYSSISFARWTMAGQVVAITVWA